jgi:hypothetical protein
VTLPVAFRPAREADKPFMISSMVASSRTSPAHTAIWSERYFRSYSQIVEGIVARVNALVAHSKNDDNHICGYVLWSGDPEPATIHYVYVKDQLRGMGLAQTMLRTVRPEFGVDTTVVTAACRPKGASAPTWPVLVERWRLRYDPYAILTVK